MFESIRFFDPTKGPPLVSVVGERTDRRWALVTGPGGRNPTPVTGCVRKLGGGGKPCSPDRARSEGKVAETWTGRSRIEAACLDGRHHPARIDARTPNPRPHLLVPPTGQKRQRTTSAEISGPRLSRWSR